MDSIFTSDSPRFLEEVDNSYLVHSIMAFAMPMLNPQRDLSALKSVDKAMCSLVKSHLQNLREVVLDGTDSGLVMRSPIRLQQYLHGQLNPKKIRKLVIRSVEMVLCYAQEEGITECELSNSDLRARTFQLPLGLLSQMNNLRHIVIESKSTLESVTGGRTNFDFRRPQRTAPLQLGLANLHEIAASCPLLKTLSCAHFEVDWTGNVTDVWGPDCSVLALRELVRGCPRLRFLGVLSSPGARTLPEYRRLLGIHPMVSIVQRPEIQECFKKSFLQVLTEDLPQIGAPLQIAVAMANVFSPTSSARGSLDFYRFSRYGQGSLRFGDLSDLVEVAPVLPDRVQLLCFVRTVLSRLHGYTQGYAAVEWNQTAYVTSQLREANGQKVQLVHLPFGPHPLSHRPTFVDLSAFHTWQSFRAPVDHLEEEKDVAEPQPVHSDATTTMNRSEPVQAEVQVMERATTTTTIMMMHRCEPVKAQVEVMEGATTTTATMVNRSTSFTANVRTEPAPLHKSPTLRSQDSMAQQLLARFSGDGLDALSEFEPFDESGDIQIYMLERSATQDLV